MTATLSKQAIEAFAEDRTPKFLATLDAGGAPNIAPVISLKAADEKTIIFAEFMIWKTKKNLLECPKIEIVLVSPKLKWWRIRGVFRGFETKGKYYEEMSMVNMFRYNAYSGIRSAGVIEVEDLSPPRSIVDGGGMLELGVSLLRSHVSLSAVRFLSGGGSAGAAGDGRRVDMPPQVEEKFQRVKAAKAIAVRDADGYPAASLCPTLFPVRASRMIVSRNDLPEAARGLDRPAGFAVSVITFDPIAYQVKGQLRRAGGVGSMRFASLDVEEVYSSCPPSPGKRIS
ncbi:MAG: pyridoxamine 5'-phosphate oxidase family protein [bacterium]